MTATLVAKNLAGGFAHRTLFESLDLTVAPARAQKGLCVNDVLKEVSC